MTSSASTPVRDAAATAASAGFRAVARVRHRKPLHPRGLVVPARLVRHGLDRPVGSSWLDEPGNDEGVARISRSAGLPDGWPDVWGLALRLDPPQAPGRVADLLLAGAFPGPAARHVLALRRGLQAPLTCILPYRTGTGRLVTIGAPERSPVLPSGRDDLARHLEHEAFTLTLAVAEPRSRWRAFATLTLGGAVLGSGDGLQAPGDISFDPVVNPLPGLVLPEPLATIRTRAYAGARAGRGADEETLHQVPAWS
ncbi:MAG TPA: hypothetical protein VE781_01855 [Kineosporiaceae bacterium]|nr:hypothetical protein [Kineosporiaceae bacterium]